jgi:Zn-dependent protease
VIAVPCAIWIATVGYSRFEPLNAALALLGFFSLGMAAFNLIPVAPLDGAMAWKIFPTLLQRSRSKKAKRAAGWR